MLVKRTVAGFYQRDRVEIIPPTEDGFAAFFQAAQEFPHGALKSIGKPDLWPGGREPVTGLLLGGEADGAGDAGRIVRPTDRALRHPRGTLHAPLDVVVRRPTLE